MKTLKVYDPIGLVKEYLEKEGFTVNSSPTPQHTAILYPEDMLLEEFGFVPTISNMKIVDYNSNLSEVLEAILGEEGKEVKLDDKTKSPKFLSGDLPKPDATNSSNGKNELELAIQAAIMRVNGNNGVLIEGKEQEPVKVPRQKKEKVTKPVEIPDVITIKTPAEPEEVGNPDKPDGCFEPEANSSIQDIVKSVFDEYAPIIVSEIERRLSQSKGCTYAKEPDASTYAHPEDLSQPKVIEPTPPKEVTDFKTTICTLDNDIEDLRKEKSDIDKLIKQARDEGDTDRVNALRKDRRKVRDAINKALASVGGGSKDGEN